MQKMILTLLAVFFFTTCAQASLINNGSFESPYLSSGWKVYQNVGDWETVSGPGIEIQNSGVVVTAQDGNQYVELDSHHATDTNSVMKQAVDLTVGSYILDFYYQPRNNWVLNSSGIFYGIGGFDTNHIDSNAFYADGFNGWTQIFLAFDIVTDGAYDIIFGAEGRDDSYGGFIDNVSLNAAPVPEPSTMILLGSGLAGLVWYRRKQK